MKRILENTLAEEAHCHSRCCAFMFFLFGCLARFTPTQNCRGVSYSRPNPGTGMPSQERFRARPMWACLEPCPVGRNYQFRGGQQPKLANSLCVWLTSVARRIDGIEVQRIPMEKAETASLRFQSPRNRHCPHSPSFSTALNSLDRKSVV